MSDDPNGRRIAIYLPSLRGGGAERVMVTLANGFASRGHQVDLVVVRAEGPYLEELSEAVRVVDLNCRRVLTSLPSLVRYLVRERPDAMLSALGHANVVAILARALSGTKPRLVVSERSMPSGTPWGPSAAITKVLMRRLYSRADKVVALSRGMAGELVRDFGILRDHIAIIPNPVDAVGIAQLARERPSHRWLHSGQAPVVLAVGRLVEVKDHQTLLAAFAQLRRQRAARLIILGDGELRSHLETRAEELGIADEVDFAGFQKNPFGWMSASAVYVMSSRHEGFPNSLVQAMACGIPVVSTACPAGPTEILEGGKWGRLVPVGDAEALALAIGAALDDPNPPDVRRRAEAFALESVIAAYIQELM
jgi:glycosyltransferase involved in cell wall biosynthesis